MGGYRRGEHRFWFEFKKITESSFRGVADPALGADCRCHEDYDGIGHYIRNNGGLKHWTALNSSEAWGEDCLDPDGVPYGESCEERTVPFSDRLIADINGKAVDGNDIHRLDEAEADWELGMVFFEPNQAADTLCDECIMCGFCEQEEDDILLPDHEYMEYYDQLVEVYADFHQYQLDDGFFFWELNADEEESKSVEEIDFLDTLPLWEKTSHYIAAESLESEREKRCFRGICKTEPITKKDKQKVDRQGNFHGKMIRHKSRSKYGWRGDQRYKRLKNDRSFRLEERATTYEAFDGAGYWDLEPIIDIITEPSDLTRSSSSLVTKRGLRLIIGRQAASEQRVAEAA